MKQALIGSFIGLLVSIAPIGIRTASADEDFDAGREWAEANEISDMSGCSGLSDSFREGCEDYVEDNASEDE